MEVFDLTSTRSGSEGCILTQPRALSPAPPSRGLPSPLAGEGPGVRLGVRRVGGRAQASLPPLET